MKKVTLKKLGNGTFSCVNIVNKSGVVVQSTGGVKPGSILKQQDVDLLAQTYQIVYES